MATVNSYGAERRGILDRRTNAASARSTRTLSAVDWIAMALLIIGGVNWGLVGLFNVDIVAEVFGVMSPVSRVVYALVGISALYTIFTAKKLASGRDVSH